MNVNERFVRTVLFLIASALSSAVSAGTLAVVNDCTPVCPGGFPMTNTNVRAGTATWVAIQVYSDSGLLDNSFSGTISVASSDPLANLPASVTFAPGDGGAQWIEVVFGTLGQQNIAATDPLAKLSPGSLTFTVLGGCVPTDTTLCLGSFRFSVVSTWGEGTPAHAVPITNDTGYFWFFDAANIEVITKALNGCDANGHFWFFGAGLTNVGTTITVTDTVTSAAKEYSSDPGVAFQPIQDTSAFTACE